MSESQSSYEWENDEVRVEIPYSAAGVSTTVRVFSKFTGKLMLMDTGDGALRDLLARERFDFVNEINLIALTHGHFDHIGGLYSLIGFMRMMQRKKTLNILIPSGCVEAQNIITDYRRCHRNSMPFQIFYHEVGRGSGFDTDFFKVRAEEVEHFGLESISDEVDLMPALGFRVRVGQTEIGYTGDTRMCEGAKEVVRDVDLAIIEATLDEYSESEPRAHLTEAEAKELAALARESILIHRIPKMEGWDR
ncbi:MBL fold metallo-hydrolase [Candidatus Thorarchaeota archaeon]|nr:MAG: MBL fold metallo-hydrolase [Candidatus Thorarchaeota archaeon]